MRLRRFCAAALLTTLVLITVGCGDTARAIHNAADAATGNQAVRESQRVREQLDQIQDDYDHRLRGVLPPK